MFPLRGGFKFMSKLLHNRGSDSKEQEERILESFKCQWNVFKCLNSSSAYTTLLYTQTQCNLIGSSTTCSRLSLRILLVVKQKYKMAERFAKVNEQEIRELLDNTTSNIPCLSI